VTCDSIRKPKPTHQNIWVNMLWGYCGILNPIYITSMPNHMFCWIKRKASWKKIGSTLDMIYHIQNLRYRWMCTWRVNGMHWSCSLKKCAKAQGLSKRPLGEYETVHYFWRQIRKGSEELCHESFNSHSKSLWPWWRSGSCRHIGEGTCIQNVGS